MNYPFTDAEWFSSALPSTSLYRGVKAGLLTLGHLRTAEALNLGILTGDNASAVDWGILITLTRYKWRKSRSKAVKSGLWWRWLRDRATPRTKQEVRSCLRWWKSQNYYPTRYFPNPQEKARKDDAARFAINRASSSVQRLALSIASIDGWQALTGCSSVWDIPVITATHLLVAHNEIEGAFHIPYNLIKEALKNGASTIKH